MQRSTEPEHWPPYHLTFWNRVTLRSLLEQAGLDDVTIKEKPFAWGEEVGHKKWIYLPVALLRSMFLKQIGMHFFAMAKKI